MMWPGYQGRGHHERGAALVVAILVMLVLSALGLVAMKSANESNWLAGTHRIGAQASSFSDSVTQYAILRSGLRASSLHALLRRRVNSELYADLEKDEDDRDGTSLLRRGGYRVFTPEVNAEDGKISLHNELGQGRLLTSSAVKGVEDDKMLKPSFQYIVRDPIQGPRAPGYGDQFCFTRVTIAAEATFAHGDEVQRRARRRLRAMRRHAADAFIGPVECGAR